MKRPPVRAQVLEIAERLKELRSQLAALIEGLPASGLRADLECALVDAFDPLLRALLAAAGKTSRSK
jgi:hypothetical protein